VQYDEKGIGSFEKFSEGKKYVTNETRIGQRQE